MLLEFATAWLQCRQLLIEFVSCTLLASLTQLLYSLSVIFINFIAHSSQCPLAEQWTAKLKTWNYKLTWTKGYLYDSAVWIVQGIFYRTRGLMLHRSLSRYSYSRTCISTLSTQMSLLSILSVWQLPPGVVQVRQHLMQVIAAVYLLAVVWSLTGIWNMWGLMCMHVCISHSSFPVHPFSLVSTKISNLTE